jgi:hypothetical protein
MSNKIIAEIGTPRYKDGSNPSDSPNYALTPNQWLYLMEVDSPSSPKNIRKNKLEMLPERFGELFEDIEAFRSHGVFSEGIGPDGNQLWGDIWEKIIATSYQARPSLSIGRNNLSEKERYQREFGIQIGRCLKYMSEPTKSGNKIEILWGVLMGLYASRIESLDSPLNSTTEEQLSNLQEILKELTERCETWSTVAPIDQYLHSKGESNLLELDRLAESVIQDFGITPTDILVSHLINETDTDRSRLSMSKWQKERAEDSFQSIMNDLVSSKPIKYVDNLAGVLEEDTKALKQEEFQGEEGTDVFNSVYNADAPIPISDLNFHKDRTQGKYILRKLAGDKENSGRWASRPLLEKKNSGWVTTDHGDAVGYVLYQDAPIRPLLHASMVIH